MARASAAVLGRGHRVLLFVGADLELFLDQLLGERGGLGLQIGDLIGLRGSRNEDHREGGRSDESREQHRQDGRTAAHSCV